MNITCISIRQPFAYAILYLGKDVENRSWPLPEKWKGKRVYLHAGGHQTRKYYLAALDFIRTACGYKVELPWNEMPYGGIVGSCIFTGCIRDSTSPWAIPGQWHWQITEARPEPFFACKGQLGFFTVEKGM